MFYNVLKLDELPENQGSRFQRQTLMEKGNSRLEVVFLKKGEIIDNHISVCDACAIVYEGEAEFHFDSEKFTLKKGELIMFKKEHEHKVLANKDTKFVLVNI